MLCQFINVLFMFNVQVVAVAYLDSTISIYTNNLKRNNVIFYPFSREHESSLNALFL
jgi:hypothetical protein